MDENIDPAKFRRLCSAFPHLGLGALLVYCGWALAWGSPAGLLVRALSEYLDLAGDRDRCGPQNPAYGGTGTKYSILGVGFPTSRHFLKFWGSRAPAEGVCGGVKIFGSTLLQPARGQLKLYTLAYTNTNHNTNPNVHKT